MARRYHLSALPATADDAAKRFSRVLRTHGEIEHCLPWVLDVAMGEDDHRARTGESA